MDKGTIRKTVLSLWPAIVFYLVFSFSAIADDFKINLKASRGTFKDSVILTWTPADNASSYYILRSYNYDGPYVIINNVDDDDDDDPLTYTDKSVENGKYYWYKVKPLYLFIPGENSNRAQGWVTPGMAGGMIDTNEQLINVIGQIPHFHNVRNLARDRLITLPQPDAIESEIFPSSSEIFEWVKGVTANDHRRIGSDYSKKVILYLKEELKKIFDPDNKKNMNEVVHEESIPLDNVYTAKNWGLDIQIDDKTIDFPSFYAVNTGVRDVRFDGQFGGSYTGEMIWADDGSPGAFQKLDEAGVDFTDKIVVALCEFPDLPMGLMKDMFDGFYHFSDPWGWADSIFQTVPMAFARSNFPAEYDENIYPNSVYNLALSRNAKALVLILKNHPGDINTHWGPYDGKMREMPTMWVSQYKEQAITEYAKNGLSATVTLEGTVKPGEGKNIYVKLDGKAKIEGRPEEIILISSHHDSCFKGATEDGTGISMVLAQASIWSRIPLEKREKSLVFLLTDGHHYRGIGSEHFVNHNTDITSKTIININLEHLAAKGVIDNGTGDLVIEEQSALTMIFVNETPTGIATVIRMLKNLQPDRTVALHSTILGDVPPGEAGHFHMGAGIDFIHWIGYPYYLLTAEDTIDKVDVDLLSPISKNIAEMVGTFMLLPEKYSDYE